MLELEYLLFEVFVLLVLTLNTKIQFLVQTAILGIHI